MPGFPLRRLGCTLAFALALAPVTLQAQTLSDILDALSEVDSVTALPTPTRCDPLTGADAKLCRAAVDLKRAELTDDRSLALSVEQRLHGVVGDHPDIGFGWYLLGMSRANLARLGVTAKPGPLQILGMSWEAGAGHALVRAVRQDRTSRLFANDLALLPLPREGASQLAERLATLRAVRPLLGPGARAATARIERVAGSRDSAVALLQMVKASRRLDDRIISFELARDLFAVGRTDEAIETFHAGVATPAEGDDDPYRQAIAWTGTAAELQAWQALPPEEQGGWLRRFWAQRDLREGWTAGTRLAEFFARLEVATRDFSVELPRSGQHRIATVSGAIDMLPDRFLTGRLMDGEGQSLGRETGITDARAARDQLVAAGLGGPFRAVPDPDRLLDDRGRVWLRFGRPDKMATAAGGEALQVWVYERFEPPLVAQFREANFDGLSGASRLVPSLVDAPPRFRDQFCGLVISLCTSTNATPEAMTQFARSNSLRRAGATIANDVTDGGRLTPAVIARIMEDGRAQVARATDEDAHPRAFTQRLTPAVQLYGLRVPGQQHGVVLASFAIPGDQLTWTQPPEAGGRTVYTVQMRLTAVDANGRWHEIDTTRRFATAAPLAAGAALTGTLLIPVEGGRYDGAIVFTQEDGRGATASLPRLAVPTPMSGTVQISSLVLGAATGTSAALGSRRLALNPRGTFRSADEAVLYYQVAGVRGGESFKTSVEFFDVERADKASLRLQFTDAAAGLLHEVERTVGLSTLKPGRYRVRVTVAARGETAMEEAMVNVTK
ncbi:MAG TPA: hypothetical protein VFN90_10340 [Gemmatimonadales bacterium]|nr:hypothetical protein [Gemmatimonadales bacterium]